MFDLLRLTFVAALMLTGYIVAKDMIVRALNELGTLDALWNAIAGGLL
jgi:hypothetical protein